MIKDFEVSHSWFMWDGWRNPFNVTTLGLQANTADAEYVGSNKCDLLSNGFKLRDVGGSTNDPNSYIYLAFAKNSFKTATAR